MTFALLATAAGACSLWLTPAATRDGIRVANKLIAEQLTADIPICFSGGQSRRHGGEAPASACHRVSGDRAVIREDRQCELSAAGNRRLVAGRGIFAGRNVPAAEDAQLKHYRPEEQALQCSLEKELKKKLFSNQKGKQKSIRQLVSAAAIRTSRIATLLYSRA